MPFGLFYLGGSGQPISAVRAFLMLALVMLAILLSRRGMTLHHVALVAMGILIVAPQSMTHPAFQMSFAAVYALVSWMDGDHPLSVFDPKYPMGFALWRRDYHCFCFSGRSISPICPASFRRNNRLVSFANIAGMPLMGVVVIPFGALSLLLCLSV